MILSFYIVYKDQSVLEHCSPEIAVAKAKRTGAIRVVSVSTNVTVWSQKEGWLVRRFQ